MQGKIDKNKWLKNKTAIPGLRKKGQVTGQIWRPNFLLTREGCKWQPSTQEHEMNLINMGQIKTK